MTTSTVIQMIRSKMRFVFLVITVGAAVSLVAIIKMGHKPDSSRIAPGFNFHPDSVVSLSWSSGPHKWNFTRDSRALPWSPEVDIASVQKKLNFLATRKNSAQSEISAPGEVEFAVSFGPEQVWHGAFSGHRYIWRDGNFKGQGAELSDLELSVFQEGEFNFVKPTWDWCRTRPSSVHFKSEGFEVQISMGPDHHWQGKTKGKMHPIDPTQIEKWLGEHCTQKVAYFRDLAQFPISWVGVTQTLSISFEDGTTSEFIKRGPFFTLDAKRAAALPELDLHLETLKAIVESAGE